MTGDDERGSAVGEFAVAMPAVLLVLAMLLGGIQAAGLRVQAQDAAADAARSWARGEGGSVVGAHLNRQLPGARVARSDAGDLVCARVSVRARGVMGRLGVVAVARSCALGGGR